MSVRFEGTFKGDRVAFGAVLRSWPNTTPPRQEVKPPSGHSRILQNQAALTSAAAGNADVQVGH